MEPDPTAGADPHRRAGDSGKAARLRATMADTLLRNGAIITAGVNRAVRTVPRHRFLPAGTPLEVAYDAGKAMATESTEDGRHLSPVNVPWLQTLVIEQAELVPGLSVLQIGSDGYSAALLAEVVGTSGQVVSVDIDPQVTDRTRADLEATGYGERVRVLLADAMHHIPAPGPFDAIIVTADAWDIPPVWLKLLSEDGRLVVPLRMNLITRVIAFRTDRDHLISTFAHAAGFDPMQGVGTRRGPVFFLPDPHGHTVKVEFDEQTPSDITLLDGVLATERIELASGVTTRDGEPFDDLTLWLAGHTPGFCRLSTDGGETLGERLSGVGVVRGDSFAYLAARPAAHHSLEFVARAYGAHGRAVAAGMVAQIRTWDHHARHAATPTFGYWPTGTAPRPLPEGRTALLAKHHGLVTITWPASADTPPQAGSQRQV